MATITMMEKKNFAKMYAFLSLLLLHSLNMATCVYRAKQEMKKVKSLHEIVYTDWTVAGTITHHSHKSESHSPAPFMRH